MTPYVADPVYLNGRFLPLAEAGVSPLDRGYLYGDGVYEVIPVYSRQPFRLDEHLTRLQATLNGVKLANPHHLPAFNNRGKSSCFPNNDRTRSDRNNQHVGHGETLQAHFFLPSQYLSTHSPKVRCNTCGINDNDIIKLFEYRNISMQVLIISSPDMWKCLCI